LLFVGYNYIGIKMHGSKNTKVPCCCLTHCSVSSKITHRVNTVYQNFGTPLHQKQEICIPEDVWRQLFYIPSSYILILHLYLNLDHFK